MFVVKRCLGVSEVISLLDIPVTKDKRFRCFVASVRNSQLVLPSPGYALLIKLFHVFT